MSLNGDSSHDIAAVDIVASATTDLAAVAAQIEDVARRLDDLADRLEAARIDLIGGAS